MTRIAIVFLLLCSCGGKAPPPTRYYQLALPAGAPTEATGQGTLVVEPFQTDGAYDDDRIVYRSGPYRLDYYDYHRWTSAPGTMLSNYLAQVLRKSGRFRTVGGEGSDDNALVLGGRVLAIEEVDTSPKHWTGRLVLELTAKDPSGKVVWSDHFEETVPMPVQSPEGLAHAMSAAMQKIATRITPQLGTLADREGRERSRTVRR